jgi:hypothetical protein
MLWPDDPEQSGTFLKGLAFGLTLALVFLGSLIAFVLFVLPFDPPQDDSIPIDAPVPDDQ